MRSDTLLTWWKWTYGPILSVARLLFSRAVRLYLEADLLSDEQGHVLSILGWKGWHNGGNLHCIINKSIKLSLRWWFMQVNVIYFIVPLLITKDFFRTVLFSYYYPYWAVRSPRVFINKIQVHKIARVLKIRRVRDRFRSSDTCMNTFDCI